MTGKENCIVTLIRTYFVIGLIIIIAKDSLHFSGKTLYSDSETATK